MIEALDALAKYWALVTWFLGMVFTMGVMWVKIETSQKAFRKLFDQSDAMLSFVSGQKVQNDNFREEMTRMAAMAKEHRDDDNAKFGEIRGRMDQIFAAVMKI